MSLIMIEKDLAEIKEFITRQILLKKDILTLKEAAVYAGFSTSYLYKLTSARKIPFYKPASKLIYISRIELEAWLLNNRQATKREMSDITPIRCKK